jgi:hypothetical protein
LAERNQPEIHRRPSLFGEQRPSRAVACCSFARYISDDSRSDDRVMATVINKIAVVRGRSGAEVQDVFAAFVERWLGSARLVGLIAENHGLLDRTCSAGFLRDIATKERFSIFQDLGPSSTACHLDELGALRAAAVVQRDIAAGCDLVLLSKFGKLEAGGGGLFRAFKAALDAQIPLVTSVSPAFEEPWKKFSAGSFTILSADRDEIGEWWQAIRNPSRKAAAASR